MVSLPSLFQYTFMLKAFAVGFVIALLCACIGLVIVLRSLSMVGDALAHASLAGVALGLVGGFNPIVGAMGFAVLAAFAIESLRRWYRRYAEIAIAIVLSASLGIAGNLSGFLSRASNFNSFLFGSLVAMDPFEFKLVIGVGVFTLLVSFVFYKELLCIAFDEEAARLLGLPVDAINRLFTLLTAFTVALAARTVGSLVVSSLLVLPVASAMPWSTSYKNTLLLSMGLGVFYTFGGLTLSFYYPLKPGSTIVLFAVLGLILSLLLRKAHRHVATRRIQSRQAETGL